MQASPLFVAVDLHLVRNRRPFQLFDVEFETFAEFGSLELKWNETMKECKRRKKSKRIRVNEMRNERKSDRMRKQEKMEEKIKEARDLKKWNKENREWETRNEKEWEGKCMCVPSYKLSIHIELPTYICVSAFLCVLECVCVGGGVFVRSCMCVYIYAFACVCFYVCVRKEVLDIRFTVRIIIIPGHC